MGTCKQHGKEQVNDEIGCVDCYRDAQRVDKAQSAEQLCHELEAIVQRAKWLVRKGSNMQQPSQTIEICATKRKHTEALEAKPERVKSVVRGPEAPSDKSESGVRGPAPERLA